MTKSAQLNPLKTLDEEPTFNEAWQAEVLAIANSLVETGAITVNDWADALGTALRVRQSSVEEDTLSNYYLAALDALENLLETTCDVSKDAMNDMKANWVKAYETTPHGAPVVLDEGGDNVS